MSWQGNKKVILSSKHQLTIPKEIRELVGLGGGEKIVIEIKNGIIKLIPKKR